ncbi:hypothetical protein FHR81_004479 [Actinoalloteichus hoggarensis]|uniref:Uncharacterized protein n=1 Tax=Actinoalloteichus hoggarensis TaxID=1470176 RepID=A0A221W3D7_9PSEU|nr:hypothetical protein AHOG_13635 [Actinoalloteichus hoggarensis]MBB5923408.1 hypothetical protein [Actinoalloteichus hoggarensis]
MERLRTEADVLVVPPLLPPTTRGGRARLPDTGPHSDHGRPAVLVERFLRLATLTRPPRCIASRRPAIDRLRPRRGARSTPVVREPARLARTCPVEPVAAGMWRRATDDRCHAVVLRRLFRNIAVAAISAVSQRSQNPARPAREPSRLHSTGRALVPFVVDVRHDVRSRAPGAESRAVSDLFPGAGDPGARRLGRPARGVSSAHTGGRRTTLQVGPQCLAGVPSSKGGVRAADRTACLEGQGGTAPPGPVPIATTEPCPDRPTAGGAPVFGTRSGSRHRQGRRTRDRACGTVLLGPVWTATPHRPSRSDRRPAAADRPPRDPPRPGTSGGLAMVAPLTSSVGGPYARLV